MKKLNLNAIRIDGGTQPRERINMEVVADYAEAVKVGIEFPAVTVFNDGAENWLADGFHRWHAHKEAGKASIVADIRQGSLKDAQLYAASREANGTHGLRRSNADKRLCVLMTLSASPGWSDNRIAEHVGVDHKTVAAHRASILGNSQDTKDTNSTVRTVERAGKTYRQDTSRIGKSKAPVAPTPSAKAEQKQPEPPPKTQPPPDDFGPSEEEIVAAQREQEEELVALRRIADSDDKLKTAMEENKQLRAQVRVMQERINSLTNEKAAAIREAKRWQKKAEAHERVAV